MDEESDNLEKEFFRFIYKRQLIWYKRFVLNQKAPWTDDEVLNTYKIINVYRELDKCTLYLIKKLEGIKDRNTLLINVIFYRFFNRYGLYEELGIRPFSNIDQKLNSHIITSFENRKKEGKPIFNNAYLISSGEKGKKKHISILDNFQKLDVASLINEIDKCVDPRFALEVIETVPMVGPFLACEIWTDLSYFGFFKQKWTDNDFVNIGPGAKWGLEIMYNSRLNRKEQEERLSHLHNIQKDNLSSVNKSLNEPLKWEDIAFKGALSNYPFLSITNIEGALCEFRKYWNIKHGKGRRKYFYPSS